MTIFEWEACAADMLATWDAWFMGGDEDKAKIDKLAVASSFSAQAYEYTADGIGADGAPLALMRAFLTAIIDPLQPSLDHLRQDPASGADARAARQGGEQ